MQRFFVMGLDLGGPADSSGLAVVEGVRPEGYSQRLNVPHLKSFRRGTGYTKIIEHILEVADEVQLAAILVDQTAAGEPVVKMIQRRVAINVCPVTIRGDRESYSDGLQFISKTTLIGGLTVAFTEGRLHISQELKETPNLIRELEGYWDRPTSASSLLADSWRDQPSDDLVFAVALACWKLEQPEDFEYHGRLW